MQNGEGDYMVGFLERKIGWGRGWDFGKDLYLFLFVIELFY